MLFHITGPAGSGKTTLGKSLSNLPNTIIIDTDEIDDSNGMEIISNPEYSKLFVSEETVGEFFNLLEQKNMERLGMLLEENKGKNIIIVGMTIYPPGETATYGYSIDIDPDNLFVQLNTLTLDTICSNSDKLKNLFVEEKNKFKVDLTILFKFKIRRSFPILPIQIAEGIELRKKHAAEIGYKYLKQDKILQDITKLIEQNHKTLKSIQSTQERTKSYTKANKKAKTK